MAGVTLDRPVRLAMARTVLDVLTPAEGTPATGARQGRAHGVAHPPAPGRKSVPWRRDPEVLARLAEVDRRHLRNESANAIALAIGVSATTVRTDLRRLEELYRERAGDTVAMQREEAIRRLEAIERLAIDAYVSDRELEEAVVFGATPGGRRPREGTRFVGRKDGALAVARQARMDIAKLQGIVVDKVAPTTGDGDDLPLAELMDRYARAHDR